MSLLSAILKMLDNKNSLILISELFTISSRLCMHMQMQMLRELLTGRLTAAPGPAILPDPGSKA
jgi:hypothetical protein